MNSLNEIIKREKLEKIFWMMDSNLLKNAQSCGCCNNTLVLSKPNRCKDNIGWRCYNSKCIKFCEWTSIRSCSFFSDFNIDLKELLKAIYFWCNNTLSSDIIKHVKISKNVITKLKGLLLTKIETYFLIILSY